MGTVQQHQVAAFTGPNDGETATGALLRANPDALREKVNAHDADATIHVQASTLASRPAAGTAGRFWVTKDGSEQPILWYDDGADWVRCGVTAAERYDFAADAAFEVGSIYRSAVFGVSVAGHTGSSYDITLFTSGTAGALAVKAGAAGETHLLVLDITAGSFKRVSIGAADSGGAGFKVLRVPN